MPVLDRLFLDVGFCQVVYNDPEYFANTRVFSGIPVIHSSLSRDYIFGMLAFVIVPRWLNVKNVTALGLTDDALGLRTICFEAC